MTKQNKASPHSQPSKAPHTVPQDPPEGKKPSIEKRSTSTALGLNNYGPMTCKGYK